MNRNHSWNDLQKKSMVLIAAGTAIALLAIHPPRWLVRVYLALERAVAAFVGVLLALAGTAALLSLARNPGSGADPVYTIHYQEDGTPAGEPDGDSQSHS